MKGKNYSFCKQQRSKQLLNVASAFAIATRYICDETSSKLKDLFPKLRHVSHGCFPWSTVSGSLPAKGLLVQWEQFTSAATEPMEFLPYCLGISKPLQQQSRSPCQSHTWDLNHSSNDLLMTCLPPSFLDVHAGRSHSRADAFRLIPLFLVPPCSFILSSSCLQTRGSEPCCPPTAQPPQAPCGTCWGHTGLAQPSCTAYFLHLLLLNVLRSSYEYHIPDAHPVPLSRLIFYSRATEELRNVIEVDEKWFAKRRRILDEICFCKILTNTAA